MRKDQVYNVGGYDPEHPSGNVLDEFEHHDTAPNHDDIDPFKGVTVRHFDAAGRVVEERTLTDDELEFFFSEDSHLDDWCVAVADERIAPLLPES